MTSQTMPFPAGQYGDDIRVVSLAEKTVVLVGTAHLSSQSRELVRRIISEERPDTVCIELDERRYQALTKPQSWETLDLKQLIKKKRLTMLFANLLLASYQKRLGGQHGATPGAELLQAAQSADELDIPIVLCDRDIRITLGRAWRNTSFLKKGSLLAALFSSFFEKAELDEEKLAEMRRQDVLSEMMRDLGKALPQAKEALIDERDIYMAEKIRQAEGKRIVAVMGAGHLDGVSSLVSQDNSAAIASISSVKPISGLWKAVAWIIPFIIVCSLIAIGCKNGSGQLHANALYWCLINGIPAALGTLMAGGHPAAIAAAFCAAPLTSLSPLIGVGYVCAFVQVMLRPPLVREFEQVHLAVNTFTGWWRNRLLRLFLVFIFSSLGSMLGTFLGGYHILGSLIG